MTKRSDIGRLFRRRALGCQEPIENFTSEALAIAIGHDDAPMRLALRAVNWPTRAALSDESVVRIEPTTQVYLPRSDDRCGYLDLQLELFLSDGTRQRAWVEVKVEAGEHGDQLDLYAERSRLESVPTCVLVLGKAPLRRSAGNPAIGIGFLSWQSIVDAVEATPGADRRWSDLVAFLREEQVVRQPVPAGEGPERHLPVLDDVNQQIRARWPGVGIHFIATTQLRAFAERRLKEANRLVATGGPLTYGLAPAEDDWAWTVSVGTRNYQCVPLDALALRRLADEAGLSTRWRRSFHPVETLVASVPLAACSSHQAAADWFGEALDELKAKGILRPFLDGLDELRQAKTLQRASSNATLRATDAPSNAPGSVHPGKGSRGSEEGR